MPMEAKDIFEAYSHSVRELLSGRGLGFYVPPYQRPYGWDKEKVSKLLEDILHGYFLLLENDESFTFLGTIITIHDINFTTVHPIVREEVPGKVLTVIDGQQRLTTLLITCIALHNHTRLAQSKMLKGRVTGDLSAHESWLNGQTLRVIQELADTFIEKQAYGDTPLYPRMIRSFDDQWSRSKQKAKYNSPIAHLIATYADISEVARATEFKPEKRQAQIEGEEALIERYSQASKLLKWIFNGTQKEELEEFPKINQIVTNKAFQKALLNHEFPEEVVKAITSNTVSSEFKGLLDLLLVSCYMLNRVAVTVVRGKNEDYAFTVFESLNTTGEPLTAFETFKPRVVSAEGLDRYEGSESRQHLIQVSNYLSEFKVGDELQAKTRDLLISFASAETGFKLSKRLADQRKYLKSEFERYEGNEASRIEFVRHLSNVSFFVQHGWTSKHAPSLHGLPVDATTDMVKLCLSFLIELNHSITIAPLVRFYSVALSAANEEERKQRIQDFEGALKAMTAFSALWRASHRGTANIDQEYRDILGGSSLSNLPPLARSLKKNVDIKEALQPIINLDKLKAELRQRLADINHGGIPDSDKFISDASLLPLYQVNTSVARFILLAAYHDTVEDGDKPGLIIKGKNAVSPCLTYDGFQDIRHLSLEHIAPQSAGSGWQADIYSNKEIIHKIGNLVLVQSNANSSLSDRPWNEKRALYAALGATSHTEAAKILSASGFDFAQSTQELAELSAHMPHLAALGRKSDDWSASFIEDRSKRILSLAWNQLYAWLE